MRCVGARACACAVDTLSSMLYSTHCAHASGVLHAIGPYSAPAPGLNKHTLSVRRRLNQALIFVLSVCIARSTIATCQRTRSAHSTHTCLDTPRTSLTAIRFGVRMSSLSAPSPRRRRCGTRCGPGGASDDVRVLSVPVSRRLSFSTHVLEEAHHWRLAEGWQPASPHWCITNCVQAGLIISRDRPPASDRDSTTDRVPSQRPPEYRVVKVRGVENNLTRWNGASHVVEYLNQQQLKAAITEYAQGHECFSSWPRLYEEKQAIHSDLSSRRVTVVQSQGGHSEISAGSDADDSSDSDSLSDSRSSCSASTADPVPVSVSACFHTLCETGDLDLVASLSLISEWSLAFATGHRCGDPGYLWLTETTRRCRFPLINSACWTLPLTSNGIDMKSNAYVHLMLSHWHAQEWVWVEVAVR